VLWERGPDRGWRQAIDGLDAVVDLPAIGVALQLAELYDGVAFPAGPRLVRGPD